VAAPPRQLQINNNDNDNNITEKFKWLRPITAGHGSRAI
jgi:hypothetical protein